MTSVEDLIEFLSTANDETVVSGAQMELHHDGTFKLNVSVQGTVDPIRRRKVASCEVQTSGGETKAAKILPYIR